MKKVSKILSVLCILGLFVSAFSGCTTTSNDSSTTSSDDTTGETTGDTSESITEDEEVVLRFSWWGAEDRHKATLEALELYNQEFPNVKVEGEYGGWDGYVQKLATQIAGNSAPDIISVPDIEAYNLMSMGVLLDLTDNKYFVNMEGYYK